MKTGPSPSPWADTEEDEKHSYDWDMIVIGGGSGGIAAAKEAGDLGAKVLLLDYVAPTPVGTSWGIGGTCVNVGCIPKKLMHTAAILGDHVKEFAPAYGWKIDEEKTTHDWETLREHVQQHIAGINFGYRRKDLPKHHVVYLNGMGTFVDAHTIEIVAVGRRERKFKAGTKITARRFLIAVGGRPTYPDIPGAKELGITSDDIFSLESSPGKTLVVGASYVALECAGFLTGLGYDVTVLVRSIFLRGFDQQMAQKIGKEMERRGTKFVRPAVPTKIEETEDGKKKVTWNHSLEGEASDVYDTVIFAIGRTASTAKMNLDKVGVKTNPRNGKIYHKDERTNIPHIYAVGDVLDGVLELTPSAIQAGKLLMRRLYSPSKTLMDYTNIPTTVFTPLEYGCCGLSEEEAYVKYGFDAVEIWHTNYTPLEWSMVESIPSNICYVKVVCHKRDGHDYVVGIHVAGPNAGEITQGMALAVKLHAKKEDLDNLVGIHPTSAEEFTTLDKTKRSGADPEKTAC